MIFEVTAELSDSTTFTIEVMACDRYEAQVMAVEALTEHLNRETSNVVQHHPLPETPNDATGQVEEATPALRSAVSGI